MYLLFESTDRYVSCVQQHNEKLVQYVISRNQALQEERDQALEESQRIAKDLASLQTVQGDSLRPEQETMFTSMVKLKLRRSENGVIQAHNVGGRPTNLLQIRHLQHAGTCEVQREMHQRPAQRHLTTFLTVGRSKKKQ